MRADKTLKSLTRELACELPLLSEHLHTAPQHLDALGLQHDHALHAREYLYGYQVVQYSSTVVLRLEKK